MLARFPLLQALSRSPCAVGRLAAQGPIVCIMKPKMGLDCVMPVRREAMPHGAAIDHGDMQAGIPAAMAGAGADPFATAGVNRAADPMAKLVKVDHFAPPRTPLGGGAKPMIEIMASTP